MIYPGGRKVAKWERERASHGLMVGDTRLATIVKMRHRDKWNWFINLQPYTCGTEVSLPSAKNAVAVELKRIQGEQP